MLTEKDKDINRLFEEIKEVDQSLLPSFESCLETEKKQARTSIYFLGRVAAAVIVVGLGVGMLFTQSSKDEGTIQETVSISDWQSTTNFQLPSLHTWESPTEFSTLSDQETAHLVSEWQSPTDFLLQTEY